MVARLVVLQATAAAQWQGANDFDNSLMNGGNVETDYDIICSSSCVRQQVRPGLQEAGRVIPKRQSVSRKQQARHQAGEDGARCAARLPNRRTAGAWAGSVRFRA